MLLKLGVFHILTFILFSELWLECCADVFSAMFKMEHLLETRQRVIDDLDTYIHKEENRLRDLKMYLKMYKTEHERAIKDKINYTGNPINAFILIKRLTSDLDDIEEIINKPTEFVSVRNVTTDHNNATILYPSAVDLQGAAVALKRLQRTYKLRVEDLARGVLDGVVYSDKHNVAVGLPMTASDCYKMGVIMFRKKHYLNALAWQKEALRKFKLEENIPHSFTKINIFEYIGIVYHHLGDTKTALDWTFKVLALDPENKVAKKNIVFYEGIITADEDSFNPAVSEPEEYDDDTKSESEDISKEDETGKHMSGPEGLSFDIDTDDQNKSNPKTDTEDNEDHEKNDLRTKSDDESETNDENYDGVNEKDGHGIQFVTSEHDKCTLKTNSQINGTNDNTKTDTEMESVEETGKYNSSDSDYNYEYKSMNEVIDYRKDTIMYEALCRGEYDIAPEISSRLSCRYLNDKPFLKLAPIKAEQKYIDPDVFLFYDVISDEEIAYVKKITKPDFKRAKVGMIEDNSSRVSDYRVSQSSWIGDHEDDTGLIARLSRRVGDFTGLNMKYAEDFQVANYGVGGHYEPHFDYVGVVPTANRLFNDDRIATAMFYMSDVAQGGATVFPKLGLSVFPVKGSTVFWMNLLPSGEGNQNTRHAACPVLEGSKWVSNKWISPLGQEFIKPCNLEHQREEVIQPRPAPVLKPEALDEISLL